MRRGSDTRNFFFCIPPVPKVNATDRTQVCNLLLQVIVMPPGAWLSRAAFPAV